MNRFIVFLFSVLSLTTFAEVKKENMDDAFGYSYQKPVESGRKFAGEKQDKDEKKRDVASDEIATDSEVKYWKFKP